MLRNRYDRTDLFALVPRLGLHLEPSSSNSIACSTMTSCPRRSLGMRSHVAAN